MKPKQSPQQDPQSDLFGVELARIIDIEHQLIRLAHQIDWQAFDERFSSNYHEKTGAPAKPTRLMVGLQFLKHTYNHSDEQTVARWVENPYWQYFCGEKYFVHHLPIDPSSMTKWRNKFGEEGMEFLLQQTIEISVKTKAVKAKSFENVNVDTTVQEKAIAFPTDARLYFAMVRHLARKAKQHGVQLRQTYTRIAKKMAAKIGRYAHAKQFKRMGKMQKKLKLRLGRVIRDIERKTSENPGLRTVFKDDLDLATRLFKQKKLDKHKLYSIWAPEVDCISKGKARNRYEFGCKASYAMTSKEGLVLGAKAFHGNPYDGHTLNDTVKQAERLSGRSLDGNVYVDQGYRGHDYEGDATVYLAGRSTKKMTPSLRRWYRRRSAIEPSIGHMKTDGRLERNFLHGKEGDRMNTILCGCGHNMRFLLRSGLPPISFLHFLRRFVDVVCGLLVPETHKDVFLTPAA